MKIVKIVGLHSSQGSPPPRIYDWRLTIYVDSKMLTVVPFHVNCWSPWDLLFMLTAKCLSLIPPDQIGDFLLTWTAKCQLSILLGINIGDHLFTLTAKCWLSIPRPRWKQKLLSHFDHAFATLNSFIVWFTKIYQLEYGTQFKVKLPRSINPTYTGISGDETCFAVTIYSSCFLSVVFSD